MLILCLFLHDDISFPDQILSPIDNNEIDFSLYLHLNKRSNTRWNYSKVVVKSFNILFRQVFVFFFFIVVEISSI